MANEENPFRPIMPEVASMLPWAHSIGWVPGVQYRRYELQAVDIGDMAGLALTGEMQNSAELLEQPGCG